MLKFLFANDRRFYFFPWSFAAFFTIFFLLLLERPATLSKHARWNSSIIRSFLHYLTFFAAALQVNIGLQYYGGYGDLQQYQSCSRSFTGTKTKLNSLSLKRGIPRTLPSRSSSTLRYFSFFFNLCMRLQSFRLRGHNKTHSNNPHCPRVLKKQVGPTLSSGHSKHIFSLNCIIYTFSRGKRRWTQEKNKSRSIWAASGRVLQDSTWPINSRIK